MSLSEKGRRAVLVLTRRVNQSIVIGDGVVVTVLEVRGDQIRLGIQAPRSVPVHREEVYRELVETNQAAASPSPKSMEELGSIRKPPPPPPPPTP